MWFLGFWNQFVGGIQKSLELWAPETIGCHKQRLMGHSREDLEEQNSERSEVSGGLGAQGFKGQHKTHWELNEDHSRYSLPEDLTSIEAMEQSLLVCSYPGLR